MAGNKELQTLSKPHLLLMTNEVIDDDSGQRYFINNSLIVK